MTFRIFGIDLDAFSGKTSGWFCISFGDYCIHFLGIKSQDLPLGRSTEPYDLCLDYFSLGWFFLWVRCNIPASRKART